RQTSTRWISSSRATKSLAQRSSNIPRPLSSCIPRIASRSTSGPSFITPMLEKATAMLDKPASALRIRERLLESERLMEETGCYDGITQLALRAQDPLKFETLHTKLRAYCVSAREMARRISASPGVREVGEMVVAIYTPEGDAIALSNGIMVHVHTMSRFIKWMIRNGYEDNPCIRDGDIFANNDAFIGTV